MFLFSQTFKSTDIFTGFNVREELGQVTNGDDDEETTHPLLDSRFVIRVYFALVDTEHFNSKAFQAFFRTNDLRLLHFGGFT